MSKKPNPGDNTPLLLAAYLNHLKSLVVAVSRRTRLMEQMCPRAIHLDENEIQEIAKKVVLENTRITECCHEMKDIEVEADGKLGMSVLLGSQSGSNALFIAASMLFGARLSTGLAFHTRVIGDVVDAASGSDPVAAAVVRGALRPPDGALVKYCHISNYVQNLDTAEVSLSDLAYSLCIGDEVSGLERYLATQAKAATEPRSRRMR